MWRKHGQMAGCSSGSILTTAKREPTARRPWLVAVCRVSQPCTARGIQKCGQGGRREGAGDEKGKERCGMGSRPPFLPHAHTHRLKKSVSVVAHADPSVTPAGKYFELRLGDKGASATTSSATSRARSRRPVLVFEFQVHGCKDSPGAGVLGRRSAGARKTEL